MNLRWTDAGRAALAASEHAGVAAVRLTHFAIGDGSGPGGEADDARATLRNERHRAAIAGTPATAGRIALRADLVPDASYSITEAGIFGTAGDPPSAPQLLLYWTDSGAAAGAAASGTNLALPAVIEFQNAAAEVAVTVGGNIVFGATDPATEAEFGSTRYATAAETGDSSIGGRAVSPKGLHAAAGKVLATLLGSVPGDGMIYQLVGAADGLLVVRPRTQDGETAASLAAQARLISGNAAAIVALADRVAAVERKVGDASETAKGVIELATAAEAKAGTDTERAVTPAGLKAALAALAAALAFATADTVIGRGEFVVPFGNRSEFRIEEAGTYIAAFVAGAGSSGHAPNTRGTARIQRKPAGGAWAELPVSGSGGSGGLGSASAAVWRGALAAGDTLRFALGQSNASSMITVGPRIALIRAG